MKKPITFALMRGNWLRLTLGLHQQEIDGGIVGGPLGTVFYFWGHLAPSNETMSPRHWLCLHSDVFFFSFSNRFSKSLTQISISTFNCLGSQRSYNQALAWVILQFLSVVLICLFFISSPHAYYDWRLVFRAAGYGIQRSCDYCWWN